MKIIKSLNEINIQIKYKKILKIKKIILNFYFYKKIIIICILNTNF